MTLRLAKRFLSTQKPLKQTIKEDEIMPISVRSLCVPVWQTFPFYLLHRDEHMSAGCWEIYAPDKAAKGTRKRNNPVKPDLKGGRRVNPS